MMLNSADTNKWGDVSVATIDDDGLVHRTVVMAEDDVAAVASRNNWGVEITDAVIAARGAVENPMPRPIEPTMPVTEADFAAAIQRHIDNKARLRGYGDGYGIASYVTSTVPSWALEAQTFVAWRDAVWIYAYGEMAKVQAGKRAQPTIPALVAELPAIVWPG